MFGTPSPWEVVTRAPGVFSPSAPTASDCGGAEAGSDIVSRHASRNTSEEDRSLSVWVGSSAHTDLSPGCHRAACPAGRDILNP
jgi:hypothetical protein